MSDHHFNSATAALLAAVTGLPEDLLHDVRIRPRASNWARAPWYAATEGGGAMVIGDRIYVSPSHEPERIAGDRARLLCWTLLMAHEVMHVGQARRFGFSGWGRFRFLTWSAANYSTSFLRNGRAAHAKAPFELEAEQGRLALRALMNATGRCDAQHQLIDLLLYNDEEGMRSWLSTNAQAVRATRLT